MANSINSALSDDELKLMSLKSLDLNSSDLAVTEVRRGVPVQKIWHIRGWRQHFEMLRDSAKCFVDVFENRGAEGPVDARLCFGFENFEIFKDREEVFEEWLALVVTYLPNKGRRAFGAADRKDFFSISVEPLDENFEVTDNATRSGVTGFLVDKVEPIEVDFINHNEKKQTEAPVKVIKREFHLVQIRDPPIRAVHDTYPTEKLEDLRLRITVTPLFIHND